MIKYKVDNCSNKIEPVEVLSETAKMVTVHNEWFGKRNGTIKAMKAGAYFDTFDEAKANMLEQAARELNRARQMLEVAQGTYDNVKGLKDPGQ